MKKTAILFLLIVSINAQELEALNEQIAIVRYEGAEMNDYLTIAFSCADADAYCPDFDASEMMGVNNHPRYDFFNGNNELLGRWFEIKWVNKNIQQYAGEGSMDLFLAPADVMLSVKMLDLYSVSSKNSLNVRDKPSTSGNKIGVLNFNSLVNIVSKTGIELTIDDNDITKIISGQWVKIESLYQGKSTSANILSGYVFDGYLSKLPTRITQENYREPIVYNEYTFEITDLSNVDSTYKAEDFFKNATVYDDKVAGQATRKFSIVVYKNGEVFQNIKTPFDMEIDIPFASRFFTVEDVNFDGYEDFYFTDYMGMVNISFIIYLYNSTSEKFEINEDYRSITSPRFDIDHQIIKSFTRGNAAYHESEIYIVLNDKLTRISKIIDDVRSNEYEYIIYDGEKEVAVNESLSKVKLNIAFFKTQKFNVIIDLLDNSNYRYASWSASKNLRNTPDLILKNGVKQETENEISYKFKKGEFSYVCIFNKLTSDGQLKVFQNKKELVKQEASVFIVPNEVKPYEGNKHKITLDIKNNLKD